MVVLATERRQEACARKIGFGIDAKNYRKIAKVKKRYVAKIFSKKKSCGKILLRIQNCDIWMTVRPIDLI
jgi:hypothetical protein